MGLTEDTASTGPKEKSFAKCESVGPVHKSRLKKKIGVVKPRDLADVGPESRGFSVSRRAEVYSATE